MKVAVAFAGLMASSVMAAGLTRIDYDESDGCGFAPGGDSFVYAGNDSTPSQWTKVNIDKFEVDDDHITINAYHYFPATAGSFLASPDNVYDNTDRFLTDTEFRAEIQQDETAGTPMDRGRALFLRIDYQNDAESSCTYTKTAGTTSFTFGHVWNACSDETCDTVEDTIVDYHIFVKSGNGRNNFGYLVSNSNTWSYTITDGSLPKNYAVIFDGYDDDAADADKPCGRYINSISAAQGGFTAGSGSQPLPLYSTGSLRNANVMPDADGTAETDFEFSPVFRKMCGDSTRVAQVAALSVASVAAGLLSFF